MHTQMQFILKLTAIICFVTLVIYSCWYEGLMMSFRFHPHQVTYQLTDIYIVLA